MYKPSTTLLGAGLATGTFAVAAIISGFTLFSNVALADVTGYDSGYTYHQGLAIGAGAQLLQSSAGAGSSATADQTSASAVNASAAQSAAATAATPSNAAVDTTGDAAVTTPVNTSVSQSAPTQQAAVDATPASTALISQPIVAALWILLALAVLALIAMGISALVNAAGAASDVDQDVFTSPRISYR